MAVAENVHVGSILAAAECEAVVDVCAEYPLFRRPEHYAAVPMLDMVPPECADLIRAVRILEQMRRAGRPVLVCCALGYGRSAAVVLLWLWAYGGCADLDAAVARLRQVRPQMVLPDAVRQSIQTANKVSVDFAYERHLGNSCGFCIGYTQTADKFALFTGLLQLTADFRTAAVNNYRTHAGVLQEQDILQHLVFQLIIQHSVAAIFYDNGFIFKIAQIRQCFH